MVLTGFPKLSKGAFEQRLKQMVLGKVPNAEKHDFSPSAFELRRTKHHQTQVWAFKSSRTTKPTKANNPRRWDATLPRWDGKQFHRNAHMHFRWGSAFEVRHHTDQALMGHGSKLSAAHRLAKGRQHIMLAQCVPRVDFVIRYVDTKNENSE